MNDADTKRILRRAKSSARSFGFDADADDIAQSVLLHFLEGKGRGQTIDEAVIDFFRERVGRKDSPNYDARCALEFSFRDDPAELKYAVGTSDGRDLDTRGRFERMLRMLEGTYRVIFCLTFKWGMKQTEIAEAFGMSPSRVCQKLREVNAFVRENWKE